MGGKRRSRRKILGSALRKWRIMMYGKNKRKGKTSEKEVLNPLSLSPPPSEPSSRIVSHGDTEIIKTQSRPVVERTRALTESEVTLKRYKETTCRLCLGAVDAFSVNLFRCQISGLSLSDLVMSFASVHAYRGDGLSDQVCVGCLEALDGFYKFRKRTQQTNLALSRLQQGYVNEIDKQSLHDDECSPESTDQANTMREPLEPSESIIDYAFSTVCEHCGRNLQTNDAMRDHFNKTCLFFSCLACCASFPTSKELEAHRNIHWSEEELRGERLPCKTCPQDFASQFDLLKHRGYVHNTWVCYICGAVATRRARMRYHLDVTHGPISHLCDICGVGVKSKIRLSNHMLTHKQPKKPLPSRICETCGKLIKTGGRLEMANHMRSHTKETPFECRFCYKRFSLDWNRVQHERIHTGELPYTCGSCGLGFRYKCSLKTHLSKCVGTVSET